MSLFASYQRRADLCAALRDRATTELGRARLERERDDWLELARNTAVREPRSFVQDQPDGAWTRRLAGRA